MIKFAVSRPPVRRAGIQAGLKLLNWGNDPFLKGYGLKINGQMLKTNARILDPPEVQFAKNATAKPLYSGRWDLRGKVFLLPNSAPLKSWGIVVLTPKEDRRPPVSAEQVNAFKKSFLDLYRGHGGIVVEKDPVIVGGVADDADALAQCFQKAGDKAKFRPQMILVILSNKSADVYNRVKRNCDCRFGVMSQCVQSSHVMKNAPQYCSNVLMKFNCKLGGTTSAIKVVGTAYILDEYHILITSVANTILQRAYNDHWSGCFSCSSWSRSGLHGRNDCFFRQDLLSLWCCSTIQRQPRRDDYRDQHQRDAPSSCRLVGKECRGRSIAQACLLLPRWSL